MNNFEYNPTRIEMAFKVFTFLKSENIISHIKFMTIISKNHLSTDIDKRL